MTNPGNNPFPGSTGTFPGQVLSKYRWKPEFIGTGGDTDFLDQFSPTITLEDSDTELHFKGTIGWGGKTGFVNMGLIRDGSTESMTFQSYSTSSGFQSIDILFTDRPGAGSFTYTLQIGEDVTGDVSFLYNDSWLEISKVYMPTSVYEIDSTTNWTWS